MVVMSMIAIFLSIAIPTYSHSIVAARERALQSDLDLLRDSIWKYTLDKQKAPQSLDDLKKDNYIDKIPDDPMTHEPNWEVVQDDVLLSGRPARPRRHRRPLRLQRHRQRRHRLQQLVTFPSARTLRTTMEERASTGHLQCSYFKTRRAEMLVSDPHSRPKNKRCPRSGPRAPRKGESSVSRCQRRGNPGCSERRRRRAAAGSGFRWCWEPGRA